MSKRIAEIIILAEDLRQVNLARHYLKRSGHSNRNLRPKIAPEGGGAGEQYVRECYPGEVVNYRSRASIRSAALVVLIDADTNTVDSRERQLDSSLRNAGLASRRESERIAALIPKRNIESWILCLTGERVDEITDYKGTPSVDAKTKQAAENLYDWSRENVSLPGECIPSLQKGLREIRRID